ncbi:helix-turn-helix domain-containing protein [Burkholderia cepacia]|uniref:helix-turn-helix domain-containing protein n=1 Tax=Burkholderia cepacia TaxID=292 RepID=UPI00389A0BEF
MRHARSRRAAGDRARAVRRAPDAADADDAQTLHARRRRAEADEIRAVLDACGGDRDRACAMLGISKTTLWRKLSVK